MFRMDVWLQSLPCRYYVFMAPPPSPTIRVSIDRLHFTLFLQQWSGQIVSLQLLLFRSHIANQRVAMIYDL